VIPLEGIIQNALNGESKDRAIFNTLGTRVPNDVSVSARTIVSRNERSGEIDGNRFRGNIAYTVSSDSDDSAETIARSEPCKFPFNRFGGKYGEPGERIRRQRFESKRRNNNGGAVTASGKRDTRRTEEGERHGGGGGARRCAEQIAGKRTEGGERTAGMFNDRELQVMASNMACLTPPPYPITREITCALSPPLIFSYRLAEATRP